jgi:bifunctional UDP-N-acetylglucosamine pyrophosphorylase/glucosamine-1-phosphate N-acetyltransferase
MIGVRPSTICGARFDRATEFEPTMPSINDHRSTISPPPQAIILAAGMGKRMGSDLPKVVHRVADAPMIQWVVRACQGAGVSRCVLVIGHGGDEVRAALDGFEGVAFVEQNEQLGTAHAAMMAEPLFDNQPDVDVFVLAGDGPLIRSKTLIRLLELHRRNRAAATLATAVLDDPTGYGRIIRSGDGGFDTIVEQKDATPDQLAIREVNPSYYCFRSGPLFHALREVGNRNAQGEYYLTDVPALLRRGGKTVGVIEAVPPEDVLSINNPEQLAAVDRVLRSRGEG